MSATTKERGEFLTELDYRKVGPRKWKLLAPLIYAACDGIIYEVPVGYLTDGASIPRWASLFTPIVGEYDWAAVLHDWLYSTGTLSRKASDDLFLEAMWSTKVSWYTRRKMYRAVRLFGWHPWNRHRANDTTRISQGL